MDKRNNGKYNRYMYKKQNIKGEKCPDKVEKVAELAGMNCNLLCPVKPDDTSVLKPIITIHGGNPVNVDSDKRGRKDILPIDPKKEM